MVEDIAVSAPEAELIAALTTAMAGDAAVMAVLGDPVRIFTERSRSAAYPHASWGRSWILCCPTPGRWSCWRPPIAMSSRRGTGA